MAQSTTRFLIGFLITGLCLVSLMASARDAPDDLKALESLGTLNALPSGPMASEITSVGKKSQRAADAAAAVFVISPEDIRRSGAISIAEALRLAPGVQVARVDASHWAISARGFNGVFANKLLVLIDGREVYSPTFGGVYWDIQDMPLEDIQRIEVIRGPGASLWGANAVNGVINIITESARSTQGGSLRAGGGNLEQGFGSLRYGMKLGENTYARVYAKGVNRAGFDLKGGIAARDPWSMTQTGFRLDHDAGMGSSLMLEGGAYQSDYRQQVLLPTSSPPYSSFQQDWARTSGFNLLGRWREALSLSSELSLQAYVDHNYRNERFLTQERDTLDLELQHRFLWGARHDVNWGLGYRFLKDRLSAGEYAQFSPRETNRQLFSAFLQDDIKLIDHELTLTLGSKLQHNDYTGFEGQPTARLLWTPNSRHSFWSAISRAVRTPTRFEREANLRPLKFPPNFPGVDQPIPVETNIRASPAFRSERLWAYELGYRFKPQTNLSFDIALFYNRYDQLRYWDLKQYQQVFAGDYAQAWFKNLNGLAADSYGAELALDWRPFDWWSIQATYSYQRLDFASGPTTKSTDFGVNPQQQAYLRSGFKLGADWDLDFWLRYVDRLPMNGILNPVLHEGIPAYLTLDTRLAWRPIRDLELSIVGQNLLQPRHSEFAQETFGPPQTAVPRSYYLQANWRF